MSGRTNGIVRRDFVRPLAGLGKDLRSARVGSKDSSECIEERKSLLAKTRVNFSLLDDVGEQDD